MRTLGLALLAALASACSGPAAPGLEGEAPAARGDRVVYLCDGGSFEARFQEDVAELLLSGRRVTLPRVRSASGAKYQGAAPTLDGEVVFWSKGQRARLQTPERTLADCRARPVADGWESAALRGIELRALGQEPGWLLELDSGGELVLLLDYATRRIAVPAPAARARPLLDPQRKGAAVRFGTPERPITIRVEDAACRDPMSGAPYPLRIAVTVAGKTYRGCGHRLG